MTTVDLDASVLLPHDATPDLERFVVGGDHQLALAPRSGTQATEAPRAERRTLTTPSTLRTELIVVNPEDKIVGALKLEVINRIEAADRVVVVMRDATTAVTVELNWPTTPNLSDPLPPLTVGIQLGQLHGRLPSDVYPVARFLAVLRAPNQFQLWYNSGLLAALAMSDQQAPIEPGFVEMIRRTAFVQRSTGSYFPIPDEVTVHDAAQLRLAERLLRGQVVAGTWSDLTVVIGEQDDPVLSLIDSGEPLLLDILQDYVVEVAGNRLSLGEALLTFHTVRRDPGQVADGLSRRLIPAQQNTYRIVLETPPPRPYDDPYATPVELDVDFVARATQTSPS